MKIACIAQLVNVIAPIRAERGGPAWRQTIYWPYQMASLHGRGTALRVAVNGPTYDCRVADDVAYLDIAATHDRPAGTVTIFALNRHLNEAADLDMALTGFPGASVAMHKAMEGHDLMATNGPERPDAIVPTDATGLGVEDGALKGRLAPLSYHVVKLKLA